MSAENRPAMMADYATFHQDRVSLMGHLILVPIFLIGLATGIFFFIAEDMVRGGMCLAWPLVSLAGQGRLHRREENPPRPFSSPWNFLGRILGEQFFKFPLFVLSGAFFKAWRRP